MKARAGVRVSLATALLAATTLAPGIASAAKPVDDAWLRGVRESGELSGPVVASGHIRDNKGRDASGQAILLAFPPQEVMSAMKVGDSVKVFPVGKTTVGPDGRFALRWDPAIPMGEFKSSIGTVDLEVLVGGSAGGSAYDFSRRVTAAPSGVSAMATTDGASVPSEINLTLDPAFKATDEANGVPAPAALDKVPPIYCINTLKTIYSPVWYLVAELYTGPHAKVDFTYSIGAEATVGVGLSVTGAGGSFSQSGKVTVGSTGSINFAEVPVNQRRVEETQWRYGKWDVSCPLYPHFQARPHTWIGGSTYYNAASTPSALKCTPYQIGDKPAIDQHKAVEWSNGVKISGIVGVDFSSTTGFTTKAGQKWTFTANGNLCGTNAYPFDATTVVGK